MSTQYVSGGGIYSLYYLFAVVYSFMVWGFWWGVFNIFVPISPIIDLIKHLIK